MTKTSRTASSQKTASAQGTGAPTPAGGSGKKRSNGGCKLPTYYFTKELRRATGPNQRLSKAAGVGLTRIVEESATALLLSMQIEAGHTVTGDAKRCKPRHQAAVLGDKTNPLHGWFVAKIGGVYNPSQAVTVRAGEEDGNSQE
jgi:hypothetical protein